MLMAWWVYTVDCAVQYISWYHKLGCTDNSKIITSLWTHNIQYIPRNMHTVFALLCFVMVIHWLIFPYPSGLLHWHCGNLTIAPVPAKQPWCIWINTSCEFIMNDCITTTKQSTTKPCAYFLGYTVHPIARPDGVPVVRIKWNWPCYNGIVLYLHLILIRDVISLLWYITEQYNIARCSNGLKNTKYNHG